MLAGSELAPNWFGASSDFGAGSELVRSMLATKFHYAVQLASRLQTSLLPNSIKSWFHVKIRLFERILFNMEPRLNGIWPQTGLRPASKLNSIMEFRR